MIWIIAGILLLIAACAISRYIMRGLIGKMD